MLNLYGYFTRFIEFGSDAITNCAVSKVEKPVEHQNLSYNIRAISFNVVTITAIASLAVMIFSGPPYALIGAALFAVSATLRWAFLNSALAQVSTPQASSHSVTFELGQFVFWLSKA